MYSLSLFMGCLAGALIIHARNQPFLTQPPSPRALAWALCSRELCTAALWAAASVALGIAMQALMVVPRNNTTESWSGIFFVINFASGVATLMSVGVAYSAVSTVVPKFWNDSIVKAEPSDVPPESETK